MLLLLNIKHETCTLSQNTFTRTETSMLDPRPAGHRSKKTVNFSFCFQNSCKVNILTTCQRPTTIVCCPNDYAAGPQSHIPTSELQS